ncbi:MAG TPA: hypothetical protein VJ505_10815 [Holophagaceae bacterium]|nr:hypothetical protein [Holophagaceae bacterium]
MKAAAVFPIALVLALPMSAQEGRAARPQSPGGGTRSVERFVDRPVDRPVDRSSDSDRRRVDPRPVGPEGRMPRTREADPRRTPAPERTHNPIVYHPGTRIAVLPAWERCTVMPTDPYWRHRDIMAEIQWISRSGSIPITPVGPGVESLVDVAEFPAGWKAYGVAVPAGGQLTVELSHSNLGWFRLMAVRKDGTPGPGMLRAMAAVQPVAFVLSNPSSEAGAVYIIVDDPGWMSSKANPYTLTFKRSWDPATTDLSSVNMAVGIWGASPSVSAEFRGPSLSGPAVYPH